MNLISNKQDTQIHLYLSFADSAYEIYAWGFRTLSLSLCDDPQSVYRIFGTQNYLIEQTDYLPKGNFMRRMKGKNPLPYTLPISAPALKTSGL